MSVKQGIILHCCFLLALTSCQTKPANSEQAAATSTANAQTTSSTEQVSTQTSTINSTTNSNQNVNTTAAATPGRTDACSLITRAEIESAQGEQVKEAQSTTVKHPRFYVSQCFYTVATAVKSVSLEVTQRAAGQSGAASPREFWEERFERAGREKEREREGKGKSNANRNGGEREEEEEKEGGPPVRVTGVGDEAFWVGNRVIGALYVLKDDSIIRISIGGPDTQTVKIEKMKALAQQAVKRLKE